MPDIQVLFESHRQINPLFRLKVVKNCFFSYYSWILYYALVAQLDRVPGYEPGGQRFESSPVQFFMSNVLEVVPFPSGPYATNSYLAICKDTQESALIDCAPQVTKKILAYLQEHNLKLTKIILTHSHWDHIADAAEIIEKLHIPLSVHKEDAYNVIQPGLDGLPGLVSIPAVQPSYELSDGDEFTIGNTHFRVIHTPGHSPGSVCLYCEKEKILFSGDTLFKHSIGNLSLPTAQSERMWPSLQRLAKLPKDTKVFPGHGASTTIGDEKWLANAENIFG